MKTYMFPGQGSQARGMGGDLFDAYPELTAKADAVLGYSIKELCLEDPRRELGKTQFTQPALYVVNALSYYKRIQDTGETPDYLAGHSLGEFNALLAAECFDFETGLKLVKKRGELMSQATQGAMAAIVNATRE
ncbi:acyltransferase domain-containing protein, partial [Lysobacter sp. 2RAB21]